MRLGADVCWIDVMYFRLCGIVKRLFVVAALAQRVHSAFEYNGRTRCRCIFESTATGLGLLGLAWATAVCTLQEKLSRLRSGS